MLYRKTSASLLWFPGLLAEQGLKVNTLNAGRSGNTLHDSLNILLNHVMDDRPDFVVLMEASNDIGVLVKDGNYRSRTGRLYQARTLENGLYR